MKKRMFKTNIVFWLGKTLLKFTNVLPAFNLLSGWILHLSINKERTAGNLEEDFMQM